MSRSRYRSWRIVALGLIALGGTEALGVGLYYGAERARLNTWVHSEGPVNSSLPAGDYIPCASMMARSACTTDAPAPTETETEAQTDREIVLKLLEVRNASSFVLATDRPEGDPPAPEAP